MVLSRSLGYLCPNMVKNANFRGLRRIWEVLPTLHGVIILPPSQPRFLAWLFRWQSTTWIWNSSSYRSTDGQLNLELSSIILTVFVGPEEMTIFVLPMSEIVLSSVFVTILSTKSTIHKTISPFASWAASGTWRTPGLPKVRKVGYQDLGHYWGSFAGQEFVVIEVIPNPTTDFPHSPRAESPEMLVLKGFSCHAHVE